MGFLTHTKKAALIAAFFIVPSFAFAQVDLEQPHGFVSDFAHVLKSDEVQTLENKLSTFEQSTGNEIAVVTISTLGENVLEDYAVTLFQNWGIGKKGQDNGVLLLIAVDDHKMRIEVGYGLEPLLTDAESFHIIDSILKPAFRQNDFYGGITTAMDRMEQVISGEVAPATEIPTENNIDGESVVGFALLGFIILSYLVSILGRSKSWWGGGIVGGFGGIIVGVIYGFFYIGIIALLGFVFFGLLFDYLISKTYRRNVSTGQSHPWWIGGGGSGGSSSGGFGGFGGGSSGGGGASGGW